MRMQSAASAKRGVASSNIFPREGSHLRELYELFTSNKAIPIRSEQLNKISGKSHMLLRQLTDFYGLDIRKFKMDGVWYCWLVGEWFGSTYLDYVADRRVREEREMRS